MASARKPEYTWKAKVSTKAGLKFVMLRIRCDPNGCWYLYAGEHHWHGPFDFPDQAADSAHWSVMPLPEALGLSEPGAPQEVSDKLSDWMKIP
jgi:hypothetical protein